MIEKVNSINTLNLKTARENLGYTTSFMTKKICGKDARIDKMLEWELGKDKPTWNQLKKVAKEYEMNIFLLTGKESITPSRNIYDFRKHRTSDSEVDSHLFKFINFLLQRQKYLSYTMKEEGIVRNKIVGSGLKYEDSPKGLAEFISAKINYKYPQNNHLKTLSALLEENNIFVMKTLSYWKNISIEGMRGVYLKDNYAPIIALNRKDSKTAQLFTLAHEVAHLFIDKEGISNISFRDKTTNQVEIFCNRVAANLLMPESRLENKYGSEDINELASKFGVSRLVVFYRLKDLDLFDIKLDLVLLEQKIKKESANDVKMKKNKEDEKSGGDYNNNMKDSNGGLFNNFVSSLYCNQRINAAEARKLLKVSIDKVI